MLISRLLLVCVAGLVAAHALRAEPKVATQTAGNNNPKSAAEPKITINSVHVDGPYIAITFDDGPSATLTPKLLDLLSAKTLRSILTLSPALLAKVTKLQTIVGRILT